MSDKLTEYRDMTEAALESFLPAPGADDPSARVKEAMRYSLLGGGKRVRGVLALAFCETCGGRAEDALPFACGIEMVHCYSLIHDDMPCMDDDDMRRGKPTNHKVYGEAMAMLAGDGLLTKAFEVVLAHSNRDAAARAGLVLASCAGDDGMVGGQCIDLTSEERELTIGELEVMDKGKTVGLIKAACVMGCIAAGADKAAIAAAESYAEGFGMAFQIRDDILDVSGDAVKLGKNTGMDDMRDKKNYVSLLGVEKAQELVDKYTESALESLSDLPGDAAPLRELVLKMRERDR